MTRCIAFAQRNLNELMRDPLSYIFCLGFPVIMLIAMTLVDGSIPTEAQMTIFHINSLTPAIAVFGLSFVMLFICLSCAKDRSGAFMTRLYATPMRAVDFIAGYMLPVLALSLVQIAIIFAAGGIIGAATDYPLDFLGCLAAAAALIPAAVLFISLGLLFGTLFGEKSAPGLCSVIISLSAFLGGIWFDCEAAGGVLYDICAALPFYHATRAARAAAALSFGGNFAADIAITSAYAVAAAAAGIFTFGRKMHADLS